MPLNLTIEHQPGLGRSETGCSETGGSETGRFEALVEGEECVIDYRLRDGVMSITHTGVAPGLEGRGIAGALVQALLDYANAHGLKVLPLCSYADDYMRRHPQTLALRAR